MEKKSKFGLPPKKMKEEDDNEENDEIDDFIADLKSTPKTYEIPKPKGKTPQQPTIKRYEPIDWKEAFPEMIMLEEKIPVYINGSSGPNFVCLHGAGHSALSFAPLAKENKTFRIISFDFRGHGFNTMSQGEDLSKNTLINDTIKVLTFVNEKFPEENIVVVGHSMGGSIATKTCEEIYSKKDEYKALYDMIQGLIVIDVVEGTAMDALPFMESIVVSRPKFFDTVDKGIEYMFKSGTIKSSESARISVPPLLKEVDRNGKKVFTWKTDLLASKKYWTEWFIGLTKSFLSMRIPKILMLAGVERMDKELTVAQMQGRFKLSIVPNVGHIIHEDNPKRTMEIFEDYLMTFKIPPKFSEIKPVVGLLGTKTPSVVIKYDPPK